MTSSKLVCGALVATVCAGGVFPASVAWARPAELPGFPVRLKGRSTASGLLLVDLNHDGHPEVVAVAGPNLDVIGYDGKPYPGFPVHLKDPTSPDTVEVDTAPVACDLDGDSHPEIIVASSSGKLWAFHADGRTVRGFPVSLGGSPRGLVACVGAGPGRLAQLVLTTDAGTLLTVQGTGGRPSVLAHIGKGAESGVAAADLDGNGVRDYVVGGGDGKVYVIDAHGHRRAGFPYRMSFRLSGEPAIGDVNDDGQPDLVFGSEDFSIHAVGINGRALPGFPVATGYRIYGGAALADLNGDGVLDIVVGSADGKLYGLTGAGKSLPGFPVKLDGRLIASVAVGDVDKDGKPDIAVVSQAGTLYVLNARGRDLHGFPVRIGGRAETAPAIGDLDGDGLPEVVAISPDGHLHAFRFKARGKAEVALVAWGMEGHDPAHSGRFAPNPARFKNISFANTQPATTDPLVVHYRYFDLDGDPERNTQIRWYENGRHQAAFDNQRQVPAERTRKHQHWRYTLQGGDNFAAYGEHGQLTRIFRSSEVEIRNSPPGAPEISLTPQAPRTTASLQVKVTRPSIDVDGDHIVYRYVWLRDAKPLKLSVHTTRIGPKRTRKNEAWRVVVVPFDGEVEGKNASAVVTIRNTPPGAAKVAIVPAHPEIGDRIAIKILQPAHDDDHDPLHYAYRYWVGDRPLELPEVSSTVPADTLRKHDVLKVRVTSWDDEVAGAHVDAQTTVRNTPPPPPAIAIWPPHPKTKAALQMAVTAEPADADGDIVTLRHQWRVDGKPVDEPTTVPASVTKKGQHWQLTVTPFDGEVTGKSVSAQTTIENTPPTAPLVVLDSYEPFTDAAIVPHILIPSTDADGDPIRLQYRWRKNGKPAGLPDTTSSLAAADTHKGERWVLDVVPNDGTTDGPGSRVRFRIRNSPPSKPEVGLSLQRPTVRDREEVRLVHAAADKDGDRLVYHYRWFKDGRRQRKWPLSKASLAPGQGHKGQHWRVEVRAFDGSEEGPPDIVEFRIVNHAPDPPQLSLTPGTPKTADALRCIVAADAVDPDGDRLTYHYHWRVDGKPVELSPAVDTIPASMTHQKQTWQCSAEAWDGHAASKTAVSESVTVVNTPPVAPKVSIAPTAPTTESDLTCQLDVPSVDADLDVVTYRYTWRVNGKRYRHPAPTVALPANRIAHDQTRRGQVWQCRVTPNDGELDGPTAQARVRIQNSAPTAPKVIIEPAQPLAGTTLRCDVVKQSIDADRDRLSYRYTWSKDGVPQAFAPTSTEIPGRMVKAHDLWQCTVTPYDGTTTGKAANSADVVVNLN